LSDGPTDQRPAYYQPTPYKENQLAEIKTREFKEASARAVVNPQLQIALQRAGGGFDGARREAIEELTPERWEELREEAREIKRHTLDNLDYYLDLLYDRVSANGGHVHFARDSGEANAIITDLARSRGVKLVTKGKSMVSEEMGLNHALADIGVEAVETDLGEYIIQLAEETPFHIIAPAIHKSRQEVSDLFAEKIQRPNLVEIEDMAQAARETLREKFINADMGITGANFVVAETGTLVIVTNEGNGRLCTSAPRVHIGITGMEKVIPSLQDLAVFLRLLPRSATGQRISSYVSMITGPRRTDDEDGPEEFHLVLVDNGRSRMLADPALREALNCIRCGACLNICPVYHKVGGHAYGWVYPGPIGAIVSPMLTGLQESKDLPYASSLCGACRDACPVKIDIPRMLLHLRGKLAESPDPKVKAAPRRHTLVARAYARLMSSPALLSLTHKLARNLQAPFTRTSSSPGGPGKAGGKKRLARLPLPFLSQWSRSRDLPPLPRETFREAWQRANRQEAQSSRPRDQA
jgi:L-lactate dehydrogenase complex protein LldF